MYFKHILEYFLCYFFPKQGFCVGLQFFSGVELYFRWGKDLLWKWPTGRVCYWRLVRDLLSGLGALSTPLMSSLYVTTSPPADSSSPMSDLSRPKNCCLFCCIGAVDRILSNTHLLNLYVPSYQRNVRWNDVSYSEYSIFSYYKS